MIDENARKKVFDVISTEDAMDKFIREDAAENHETNRLVHVMFKQVRQQNEHIRTQSELFLDNWAFQHGGITKDNFREVIRAYIKFARHILQLVNAKREQAEYRAMCGALGDNFDGEVMQDLPSEDDFRQAAVRYNKEHGL